RSASAASPASAPLPRLLFWLWAWLWFRLGCDDLRRIGLIVCDRRFGIGGGFVEPHGLRLLFLKLLFLHLRSLHPRRLSCRNERSVLRHQLGIAIGRFELRGLRLFRSAPFGLKPRRLGLLGRQPLRRKALSLRLLRRNPLLLGARRRPLLLSQQRRLRFRFGLLLGADALRLGLLGSDPLAFDPPGLRQFGLDLLALDPRRFGNGRLLRANARPLRRLLRFLLQARLIGDPPGFALARAMRRPLLIAPEGRV